LSTVFLIGVLAAIPAVIVPVEVSRNGAVKPPSCGAQPGGPQPHCIK